MSEIQAQQLTIPATELDFTNREKQVIAKYYGDSGLITTRYNEYVNNVNEANRLFRLRQEKKNQVLGQINFDWSYNRFFHTNNPGWIGNWATSFEHIRASGGPDVRDITFNNADAIYGELNSIQEMQRQSVNAEKSWANSQPTKWTAGKWEAYGRYINIDRGGPFNWSDLHAYSMRPIGTDSGYSFCFSYIEHNSNNVINQIESLKSTVASYKNQILPEIQTMKAREDELKASIPFIWNEIVRLQFQYTEEMDLATDETQQSVATEIEAAQIGNTEYATSKLEQTTLATIEALKAQERIARTQIEAEAEAQEKATKDIILWIVIGAVVLVGLYFITKKD